VSGRAVDRIHPGERSATVAALARAFHDDPVFNFLIPDLRSQARAALTLMGSVLNDALPFGEVWVGRDGGSITGAAVWLPPGAYPRGTRREAITALQDLRSVPRIGGRLPAGLRIFRAIDDAHRRVDEPHWYLALLGCDPKFQRRGIGTALLAPVLARADHEHFGAYLETQTPDNVPWYRRFGFDVVDELKARDCPPMWAMYRDPK
jgi:GNAT superfamily N-acetyltransferase